MKLRALNGTKSCDSGTYCPAESVRLSHRLPSTAPGCPRLVITTKDMMRQMWPFTSRKQSSNNNIATMSGPISIASEAEWSTLLAGTNVVIADCLYNALMDIHDH